LKHGEQALKEKINCLMTTLGYLCPRNKVENEEASLNADESPPMRKLACFILRARPCTPSVIRFDGLMNTS
jgi:hypothetical protein